VSLALWLVPPTTRRSEYATFIDAFADRYGTPRFVPHVTLLTGVPSCDETQLRALADICRGIELQPRGLATFAETYRALVVEFDLTDGLARARDAAARAFRADAGAPASAYEPHLPLMYGDLAADIREEARRSIEATVFPPFVPEVLQVVNCVGPPDRWHAPLQLQL
jgi:2'-5' RNA ligase